MCEKCNEYARMLGFRDQGHLCNMISDKLSDCVEDFLQPAERLVDEEVRNSRITKQQKYAMLQMLNETVCAAIVSLLSHHVDENRLDPALTLRNLAVLMERDRDRRIEEKIQVKPASASKNFSMN